MSGVESFDIAIAGGGPAGAAAALTLAREGRRVLLADAAPAGALRIGEGLPPSARSLLRDLGVLERFLAGGHRISYGNLSVWGSWEAQASDFIFQWHGHGFQLDRARFDAMLRAAAREAGVQVYEETRLTEPCESLSRNGNAAFRLRLAGKGGNTDVDCSWLVDASGRAASLARRQGAKRLESDRLVTFYALLRSESGTDQDGRTLIEAGEDGWWYSVLLPSSKRLAAYLTDLDLADRKTLLSAQGFRTKLAETRYLDGLCRQHRYVVYASPRGADASSSRLDRFAGKRWLAMGDAALSFDPLSSQGILNALYTGLKGGQAVSAALAGDTGAIDRYAAHLAQIYEAYLRNRTTFYGYETRWATYPFWRRRAANLQ